jgi:SAM-dependent methyltransferase
MVSKEDVIRAYQLLLGRNPENDSVVRGHMRAPSLEHLRQVFIQSPEFQMIVKSPGSAPGFPAFIDRAEPIRVEVKTDDDSLAKLLARVERCWTQLGETEPHWSVLTDDLYKQQNFGENAKSFYNSGKQEANRLIAWLERNAVERSRFDSCLELGCGTGRITPWLAEQFARTIACDISKPHLVLAAAATRNHGVTNVEFVHISGIHVLETLPKVDVIFSFIVLQHNPPPVIYALIKRLLGLLNPGGAALLQVPTYGTGYSFEVQHYLRSREHASVEMHLIPQRFVFELAEAAGCHVLEVEPDLYISTMTSWMSNTFLIRKH